MVRPTCPAWAELHHHRQGEDLEDAGSRRGPAGDPRLLLREAARAAPERQEGHRRRGDVQEAPAAAVGQARAAGRQARHAGPPGARAGREDLARAALERKQLAQTELQSLDSQVAELEDQQQRLVENEQKLRAKIEAFRTKKEVIKAQYSAAEAQVQISEAATGVGEQMADVGLAMQRAVDKTEQMRARASAVEELEAAGTFEDITALGEGERRHRPSAQGADAPSQVDDDLAKMRAEIGAGDAPKPARQLEQGEGAVIVRIATEDQFELVAGRLRAVNELDNAVVEAVEAGDEARSRSRSPS